MGFMEEPIKVLPQTAACYVRGRVHGMAESERRERVQKN